MKSNRAHSPSKAGANAHAKTRMQPRQPPFADGATPEPKPRRASLRLRSLPRSIVLPKTKCPVTGGSFKSSWAMARLKPKAPALNSTSLKLKRAKAQPKPVPHPPALVLSSPPQAKEPSKPLQGSSGVALLADPILMEYASKLEDFERFRIACSNQAEVMTRSKKASDKDGGRRGQGMSPDEPGVKLTLRFVEGLKLIEKGLEKQLVQQMSAHPLYPFVRRTPGLGGKTVARLIGVIGDPYRNSKEGRPRMVSELWSYCGVHGPDGSKRKGYSGKTRAWVIATNCIKMTGEPYVVTKGNLAGRTFQKGRSPYRQVYDEARTKAVDKLHTDVCFRCGPSGSPAKLGSPWSEGHQHGHAVRMVMKQVLLDLWLEAKRLHEAAQLTPAGIARLA